MGDEVVCASSPFEFLEEDVCDDGGNEVRGLPTGNATALPMKGRLYLDRLSEERYKLTDILLHASVALPPRLA